MIVFIMMVGLLVDGWFNARGSTIVAANVRLGCILMQTFEKIGSGYGSKSV